jgi:transcriptional regulator with XRE-family HTH domain
MKLRIKEICKNQGITMSELANRLEIPRENVTKLTTGNLTIKTLEKIASALNVPVQELFPCKITGIIRVDDKVHSIYSIQDLQDLLEQLKGSGQE